MVNRRRRETQQIRCCAGRTQTHSNRYFPLFTHFTRVSLAVFFLHFCHTTAALSLLPQNDFPEMTVCDRDAKMQRVQSQWIFQYLWRSFVSGITFNSYSTIIDFNSSILLALSLSLAIPAIFRTCLICKTSSLQVFLHHRRSPELSKLFKCTETCLIININNNNCYNRIKVFRCIHCRRRCCRSVKRRCQCTVHILTAFAVYLIEFRILI